MSSPAVKPCPHCGSSVAAEVQFCSQCGKTIELGNQEITRRVPITIDEATADPTRVESKATVVGNAGEFSKTITDTSSVEQMLALPRTHGHLPLSEHNKKNKCAFDDGNLLIVRTIRPALYLPPRLPKICA